MGDLKRTISPYVGHVPMRYTALSWLLEHPISANTSTPAEVAWAGRELVDLVHDYIEYLTGGFARLVTYQRPHLVHEIRLPGARRLVPEVGGEYGRVHLHFNMLISHTMYDLPDQPGEVALPEVAYHLPLSGLYVPDCQAAMVEVLQHAGRPVANLVVLCKLLPSSAFQNYAIKEDQEREFARRFAQGELRLRGRARARQR